MKVLDFLQKIFGVFQEKGEVAEDLNLKEASYMLYGIIFFNLLGHIYLSDSNLDNVVDSLNSQIDILFKGFKPCDHRRSK